MKTIKPYKVTSTWSAIPGCVTTFHTSLKAAVKRAKAIKGHLFQHNPFAALKDHTDEFGEWERIDVKP